MSRSILTRRQCLGAGAAVAVAASCSARLQADESSASVEPFPTTAEEALTRLRDGNRRFISGTARHPHAELAWRRDLEQTQKPFATVLSCSDSRVPPELLFDQGFGDLFVIRVAGHVIDPSTLGSLQYALVHLKTPLFLVLGHEHCGAVTAAVQALLGEHQEPAKIQALVDMVEPGLEKMDLHGERDAVVRQAVAANVRWTLRQLTDIVQDSTQLAGAVYELDRGEVEMLT
ncbi:MAG: carbonic anhydrase [Planctomycetia bacterium]|nr:carbonic anhydrase [Planctomycetia bacterium]